MKRIFLLICFTFCILNLAFGQETLKSLAGQFVSPKDEYKPQAWWHWLGTNYSKEGMTADLEAIRLECGALTLKSLAGQFVSPKDEYKPQAWWHWLGTNYSKEGMTADLEAIRLECGAFRTCLF